MRFDAEGAAAAVRLAALGDLRDASILAMLVAVLEEAGFEVASQTRYIEHLVPTAGVLGARALTADESRDAALGLRIARGVAGLDIGQAVAVGRGVVVAVEAAEGTDAMIRRSGALAEGIVVVKVSRPRQDPRYDLPVVGPGTIAALAEARGAALVVEAGRTILLERDALVRRRMRPGSRSRPWRRRAPGRRWRARAPRNRTVARPRASSPSPARSRATTRGAA